MNTVYGVAMPEQLTNNIAEGWDSSFHRRIQAKNSIFKFLEGLLEEQGYENMKLDHQLAGYKEPETKRHKDKNDRLTNVVKQFTQEWNETEDYYMQVLHQIAYNLSQ